MSKKRTRPIQSTTPKGDIVNLFTTEQVAEKIGRNRKTLIRWEQSGILPKTFFVFKNSKTIRNSPFGDISRLYTEEQVNILTYEMRECQVMSGRRIPDKFKRHLHSKFEQLAIKYGLLEVNSNE